MTSTSADANGSNFRNNNLIDPKSVYMNEETADVHFEFEVNEEKILVPAHKIILALRSSVFYAMFFGDLKETGNIKISDASVNGFKEFLALFYLDEVKISDENIFEIINLANMYDMPQGLDMCEQILLNDTTTDELCSQLSFAIKHNLNNLQKYCKEKIQAKAAEILKSDDFINVTKDLLKVILQLDDFNCSETDIFDACMKWAKNVCEQRGIDPTNKQNLRQVLGDCFYLIPITAMNIQDFSRVLSANTSLFAIEEVSDIIKCITIGESTEYTNKFAFPANKARKFDWDKKLLKCEHGMDTNFVRICVNEYTTFSSSHKLLFGALRLFRIVKDDSITPLLGTVSILKRGETLMPNRLHEKIQFFHENDNWDDLPMLKLNTPLIIEPHQRYTIHIDFSANKQDSVVDGHNFENWRGSGTYYDKTRSITTQDNENIEIKFHKDPEVLDSQALSQVSALYFNRL